MVQIREPASGFKLPGTMPPYFAPLIEAATNHGVSVVILGQAGGPELPPMVKPWICVIGDDLPGDDGSPGPKAFGRRVRKLFHRAEAVIVLAAEALFKYYAAAATTAVVLRKNAILVETRPEHAQAWQQLAVDAGVKRILLVSSDLPPTTNAALPLDATRQ